MPSVACTALKATMPRASYSTSASGACSPIDYASSPVGVCTPGRKPQVVKSTLSYLDLAVPRSAGEASPSMGGSELPGSTSSSITRLARTWAHDLSADARRNRKLAGVGASASGSSAAYCAPAKVAIVIQLELLTDRPLRLSSLTSAEHQGPALLEPAAFERAAARKQNRAAPQRQSQLRFTGTTRTVTSEAVGYRHRSSASSGSSSSVGSSGSTDPKEPPK
ncbi:uncharacterized protein LOC125945552 [Dermacentor silvarum]|uniref:uncharacterized protein LOC125945552 n=1 Tax=Dermacentor silvarum TaxID=543639 RepID=UPI002101C395|nr:uncharacterized protein LOC125945552 [Dermacentor silvarum]